MRKLVTIAAMIALCMMLLAGCGTEPIAANIGEPIETEGVSITVDSIQCDKIVGLDSSTILDTEDDHFGYLACYCNVEVKQDTEIPLNAIRCEFSQGGEPMNTIVGIYKIGGYNQYEYVESMKKGNKYVLIAVAEVYKELKEVGAADLKIAFNKDFSDVTDKDIDKLDNIYTLTEENTYKVKELKDGDNVKIDGHCEFTVKDSDKGYGIVIESHIANSSSKTSYNTSRYGMYLKLDYKNLEKIEMKGFDADLLNTDSLILNIDGEEYDDGYIWYYDKLLANSDGTIYLFFEAPEDVVKKGKEKVATFTIENQKFSYKF